MQDSTSPSEPSRRLTAVPERFSFDIRPGARAAVWIYARGELDASSATRFAAAVESAFTGTVLLIIDLRELTFIDSTGLGMLVEADASARRTGRRLILIRGTPRIERLLRLTRALDQLEIIDLHPILVPQPPGSPRIPPKP